MYKEKKCKTRNQLYELQDSYTRVVIVTKYKYIVICQWLAAGPWFSPGTPFSSTNINWSPRLKLK